MWEDVINLASGHSLIMGHLPEKLKLAQVSNKLKEHNQQDIVHLGLFDASSPNYTTYYPEATAEDFNPKEDEFIYPTFRALSEVIVHKEWNPVDFSMNGALKKSMNLLVGATINPDHESRVVGNALGSVKSVDWELSNKVGGIIIPAGINAVFKLDAKSNPRIARGIMMDPPSIHSNSVTVRFLWDKSHPELSEDEFWGKLGTFDKDGQMIRRIVNRVKNYPETSLVHHGADPFAQKRGKDGKIVNPQYADSVYNSEQWPDIRRNRENENYFFFDYKLDLIENSEKKTTPAFSNTKENNNSMDFLKLIAKQLGLSETATEQEVLAALTARLIASTNLTSSLDPLRTTGETDSALITRLSSGNTNYQALLTAHPDLTVDKLKSLMEFQTTTLTNRRNAVTALYNKLKDNKGDAGILSMISGANLEALASLENQYQTELDAKFPLKCKSCQSTDITRQSSAPTKEDPGKTQEDKGKDNVRFSLAASKRKQALGMKKEESK